MATRLDRSNQRTPAKGYMRPAIGWVASGELTASIVVKPGPGILGGVLLTASDDTGQADVLLWDSATASLDAVLLARVTVVSQVVKQQNSTGTPSAEGIIAEHGIYAQVVAGACSFIVYYK